MTQLAAGSAVATWSAVRLTTSIVCGVISSLKWQAACWPGRTSRSSGSSAAQRSGLPSRSRSQQRVWKRQPDGGATGDGTSPLSTMRFLRLRGSGLGHGRQQRHGVGVARRRIQLVDVGDLDELAEVHDPDPVADVLDDREVVGDEQVGEAELLLEVVEEVEDLALDRDVEGGDGLVADDELGVEGERPGDADALPLAAGELVRVAMDVALVEADPRRAARGPSSSRSRLFVRPWTYGPSPMISPTVMRGLRLAYGSWKTICMSRRTAHHLLVAQLEDRLAVDRHRARRRRDEPQDDLAERRLAAAGLADQAERLAASHVEADAVDGPDRADLANAEEAAADREVLDEVLDLDEHVASAVLRVAPSAVAVGRFHRHRRRVAASGGVDTPNRSVMTPPVGRPRPRPSARSVSTDRRGGLGLGHVAAARPPRRPAARRSGVSQQRENCPGATCWNGGAVSQIGIAYGQRRLNRQPLGRFSGLGTVPWMTSSRSRRSPRRGIDASRPLRVRVVRPLEDGLRRRPARRPCRHT